MHSIFSSEGRTQLDRLIKPGLLCAFDFDGTLAPLVLQPEHAALPEELRLRLVELSAYTPIALITGRSLQDIRSRMGFEPDFVIGNHGIEGLEGWEERATNYQILCKVWHDHLAATLKDSIEFGTGVIVENKQYSLSVHYRHAKDYKQAEARLMEIFNRLDPLPRVITGKDVLNLLPDGAADKGVAMEELIKASQAKSAIYLGDDVTDEEVFKLKRDDLLSIRVEQSEGSAANFFVPTLQDMAQLLDDLITRLKTAEARNWMQFDPVSV